MMAGQRTMNRRGFLRNTFIGGAGLTMMGTPLWEAAAQLVNTPQDRNINGIGLEDPTLVQLSINENPLGASPRAIEAVAKQMFGMNRYPFHYRLEEALAEQHDVRPEMVMTGTGSSEILNNLVLAAFYEHQGNTVTGFPSYPYIPQKTSEFGGQLKKVPLTTDWGLDLDAMAKAINDETRIVSVCNPNNPTGQILDPAALRSFLRAVPGNTIVCVDEAYIHFTDDPAYPSMIPLTKELDNLVVSRTFSKAYGLGGVRVGYGIGNPELLGRLRRFGIDDLNKNTLSIAAALGALEDPNHVARTVRVVQEGKKYLYAQLEEMGYQPIRTQTIFVTVKIGDQLDTFVDRLRERKVNVSRAFDMDGYMRISVGLPRENEAFIHEFRNLKSTI